MTRHAIEPHDLDAPYPGDGHDIAVDAALEAADEKHAAEVADLVDRLSVETLRRGLLEEALRALLQSVSGSLDDIGTANADVYDTAPSEMRKGLGAIYDTLTEAIGDAAKVLDEDSETESA